MKVCLRTILAAGVTLLAGVGTTPVAHAADDCLRGTPYVGRDTFHLQPQPILDADQAVPLEVQLPLETSVCDGISVTVRKADGTHLTVVPLDQRGGTGMPPAVTRWGTLTIPRTTGAGDWVITKLSRGTESVAHSIPFTVIRGSLTTIDPPAASVSPAKAVVTGGVTNYTATGTAPSVGRKVQIIHQNGIQVIANTVTGSTGRFRVEIPFTRTTTMRAVAADTATSAGSGTGLVTAVRYASLPRLSASPTAYVNQWWKVVGTAYPGKLWTDLYVWDGTAWQPTQSFGLSAADGTFARWWKPSAPGTFRLRLRIGPDVGLQNTPLYRELTVKVTSLQTQPTYLDGRVGPTSDPVVVQGTKMSSYGHLRVRYTTGAVGPFAGQVVLVQARPAGSPAAAWDNVASTRTTSTGYFYVNWNMHLTEDAEVRYVYPSPHVTIRSTQLQLGAVAVQ